ncbi:uncharacterized protein DUF3918 [Cytobacillus horneckiae]|uniref:DUF3918 domain-containing protein n=1 Tax=Cytobacillus horneckiae TaxID=549687 RepID=A0A2N0ZIA2_9BACI|nr:DUF3918 family protein [Cytobacillus horneckiae]MBN6887801.1 DUF3918 family protein [Cytobacillus horneckiae]MCM3179843.1 DUF3918 family protein [Cytobacillus horneckiae]MEC1155232.1 DUF3918 family protein [Cytobacillus horneckiae]MED2936715.1 DUF3918 family protein [Cytobacillus horneckiae]PKG29216.1 DUF3918 domain-containing protein [Cytobacillus horneckiae]
MNKMLTSAAVIGAGIAAYGYVQKNNLISKRDIKRIQRKMNKLF